VKSSGQWPEVREIPQDFDKEKKRCVGLASPAPSGTCFILPPSP
jgi:hypothetical protein